MKTLRIGSNESAVIDECTEGAISEGNQLVKSAVDKIAAAYKPGSKFTAVTLDDSECAALRQCIDGNQDRYEEAASTFPEERGLLAACNRLVSKLS